MRKAYLAEKMRKAYLAEKMRKYIWQGR